MRFFGHSRTNLSDRLPSLQLGLLGLLLGGVLSPLHGQAPYVLPYTMSTYAGGSAAVSSFSIGTPCNGNTAKTAPFALDTAGDGCLASQVLISTDPHDVRVDPKGNVFYGDNSNGVVHKFNPYTGLQTIAVGNLTATTGYCGKLGIYGTADKYGDGCTANDGVANNSLTSAGATALFTPDLKGVRGLGIAPNGNLFIASYNDYLVHELAASTNFFSLVAGSLTSSGSVQSAGADTNGPNYSSLVNDPRGVAADAAGNVFIADTSNNDLRLVNQFTAPSSAHPTYTPGVVSDYTTYNPSKTLNTSIGPYSSALLAAPEDVKIDSNGNIYIADYGNNVIRAIFNSADIGTLPGIPAPVAGDIYVVAGGGTGTYPTGGSAPVLATSINFGAGGSSVRKIGIDSHNNVYLDDSIDNVVWFLDAATGYMRVIAGSYGNSATYSATPTFVCSQKTDAIGDGCPGTQASLFANSNGAVDPDFQGNIFIADSQGGTSTTISRIRKQLSGLNFPATTSASPVTQNILVHFAPGDTPAAVGNYTINNPDFVLKSAPACTVQADNTDDCLLAVTFTPSATGFERANLTVASVKNGTATFVLTGTGTAPAVAFDPGNTALLTSNTSNPQALAIDPAGNVYIADTANNRVLYYNATTTATTIIAGGSPATCAASTDTLGLGDGCAATGATLKSPAALALGSDGYLYIADTGNNLIRRINLGTGIISLYGGGGTACSQASDTYGDNCSALNATFSAPAGLAADNLGNLFVADTGNNRIREIGHNGWVSLFAGGGSACTSATDSLGDGCPAAQTLFNKPTGLAFDITGAYLFVADTGNSDVRKIYLDTSFSYTGTGTSTHAANILINPVTLVAGVGQAQSTVSASSIATLSGLSSPTGVAVDAAENVYIADTGNQAVRLVNNINGTGIISTIAGILGTGGTGTIGTATVTQLNAPAAVAVSPLGTLFIADSGNGRVLSDARSAITYNFGRVNEGTSSPTQSFTELNISTSAASSIAVTQSAPVNNQFTLVATANNNSSIPACGTSLAVGAACNLVGQFTPGATGPQSSTFTESPTGAVGSPAITLSGTGAVLTPTNASVAQTTPATGNPQFGGTLTFTATVAPNACNTAAPACYPSGTVVFVVDGVSSAPITLTGSGSSATASFTDSNLAVKTHTVSCNYSGDFYYAPQTCPVTNFTVVQANTTSMLAFPAGTNNQPQYPTSNCSTVPSTPSVPTSGDTQCIQTTLVATVASTTVGTPTGSVTFLVNGVPLDGTDVNPIGLNANGMASFPLTFYVNSNGTLDTDHATDGSLPPGTYNLSCIFNGPSGSNYAGSNCTPVQFTVAPQVPAITLVAKGCIASSLYPAGQSVAVLGSQCTNGAASTGAPTVATADGSTTDATIFIIPTNTVSGTLTFSCSGLPTNTACTFQPSSLTLTAGTAYAAPVYTDVTFFTDVQPGNLSSLARPGSGISLATIFGWPLTAFSLITLLMLRRRKSFRGLSLLAMLVLMAGTALTFSGCAGPGNYTPALTPAGTYPVTVTVKGPGVSSSTIVNFAVTAPGITGQQ